MIYELIHVLLVTTYWVKNRIRNKNKKDISRNVNDINFIDNLAS